MPKLVGLDESLDRLGDATWYWIVIAVGVQRPAFARLRRPLPGGPRRAVPTTGSGSASTCGASYQITMAGLAATRIFSAAGAGGIVLTYWALRKAGMARRAAACRMVAFLVLMYSVYLLALVIFGVLLRTGVLPGDNPVGGTIVPAAVAAGALVLLGLDRADPRRLRAPAAGVLGGTAARAGSRAWPAAPATLATGVRTAIDYLRHPSRGALAAGGLGGLLGRQHRRAVGQLRGLRRATSRSASLVQGFFVGMAANLVPSPAGGVGSVDAGMIGAFVLFGIPSGIVFPAVLTYR